MTGQEAKDLTKMIKESQKNMENVLVALNKNVLDCAKSLRGLADAVKDETGDYWHPVFGPDGEVPGEDYDWVLVKIRDIGTNNKPYNVPHIAEFRKDGLWWALEWNEPYGVNEKVPFEVVFWRPIPGDTITAKLFADSSEVRRYHEYGE